MPPKSRAPRNTKKNNAAPKSSGDAMDVASSEVSSVAPSTVAPSTVAPSTVAPSAVETAEVPVEVLDENGKPKKQIRKKRTAATKPKQKRGPSSYILFTKEFRTTYEGTNKLSDMSKACGAAWKKLTDEQKDKYRIEANNIRLALKADEPPRKPKRAISNYLLFAMEERKRIIKENPSIALAEVSKKCGALWKTMSDDEKQVWKVKAQDLAASQK